MVFQSDTFRERAAEALADEVGRLIERRVIDSRSPAGDALLDYRQGNDDAPNPRRPFREELIDALRDIRDFLQDHQFARKPEHATCEMCCETECDDYCPNAVIARLQETLGARLVEP